MLTREAGKIDRAIMFLADYRFDAVSGQARQPPGIRFAFPTFGGF